MGDTETAVVGHVLRTGRWPLSLMSQKLGEPRSMGAVADVPRGQL